MPQADSFAFLFTDIEGSTVLWERYPDAMRMALAVHDKLLRGAIERREGGVFKTVGDAFCAVFSTIEQAIEAAVEAQHRLHEQDWGAIDALNVRMAIYYGEAEQRDHDYFGVALNRVARLRDAAHGEQILIADVEPARFAIRFPQWTFRERGSHRLKGILQPLQIYQIQVPGLPEVLKPIVTLSSHPNNLPASVSSFVGREAEMREVATLLQHPDVRLLTLTGFGGTGKTRLALSIAEREVERYPQGAWFVDLSSVVSPDMAMGAVARACGLQEDPTLSALDQLSAHFRSAKALLLLDNFEHIPDAADDVALLLRACPHLSVLVTSRVLLDLSMEFEYKVPVLELTESLQLFTDRARQASPSFALTFANHPIVTSICQKAEMMPLLIELAAARLRQLTLEEIDSSLQHSLETLATRYRDLPARHRSLRGVIDWSYSLLMPYEQRLYRLCTVFTGGFTLEAIVSLPVVAGPLDLQEGAEQESEAGNEVAVRLKKLVGHSLLRFEPIDAAGNGRFRMLESLREYGLECLEREGEGNVARTQHCNWFLRIALEADGSFGSLEEGAWLERIESDHDNMRSALHWCQTARVSEGLRLARSLCRFWEVRGYFREGRASLDAILGAAQGELPGSDLAHVLRGAGILAWYQSDFGRASGLFTRSLDIFRQLEDRAGIAKALSSLADIRYAQGDLDSAFQLHSECLKIHREREERQEVATELICLGNIRYNLGDYATAQGFYAESLDLAVTLGDQRQKAFALNNLGLVANEMGQRAEATSCYERSLVLRRELRDKQGIALTLNNLARLDFDREDLPFAETRWQESLSLLVDLGDQRLVALTLYNLAALAMRREENERALCLYAATERIRNDIGAPMPPVAASEYVNRLESLRTVLGDATYQKIWAQGSMFTVEETVRLALKT